MGGMPRALAATAMGAGIVFSGGAALALWSTNGVAAGGAVRPAPIRVIAEDGPPDLFPGFDRGDVYVRLKNPNPFPVTVESLEPTGVTSGNPSACPASNITVRPAHGLSLFVDAGSTTGILAISDVVSMARDAPDGCAGVGFDIGLAVTGSQVLL
jgi:hypothetical protein